MQNFEVINKKITSSEDWAFLEYNFIVKIFYFYFPSEFRRNYAVKTKLDTKLIERTDGYIDTLGCDTQKNSTHYGKVMIQDYIDKVRYRCKI